MSSSTQHNIAGFWRRFFAFLIDGILVGALCWIISSVLGNFLFKFPILSIFIGYLIVVSYFGLLNSHLHHGQTFAKQLLHLQVTQINGQYLTISSSMLRAAILFAPPCLMSLNSYISITALGWVCATLLATLQCLIVYFYIFNRRNRRSVHDFVAKSIVIYKNHHAATVIPKMWNKRLFFAGAIALLGVIYSIVMFMGIGDLNQKRNHQLTQMQPEIIAIKEIADPDAQFSLRMFEIQVNDPNTLNNPFFAQQFVEHLENIRPDSLGENAKVIIVLISKFQFGLASKANFNMYSVETNDAGQNIAVEQISSLDF